MPSVLADLENMDRFALTLSSEELSLDNPTNDNWESCTSDSTLMELRTRLYVEQRRWNHFCRMPDDHTISEIRRVIGLIRAKLIEKYRKD